MPEMYGIVGIIQIISSLHINNGNAQWKKCYSHVIAFIAVLAALCSVCIDTPLQGIAIIFTCKDTSS